VTPIFTLSRRNPRRQRSHHFAVIGECTERRPVCAVQVDPFQIVDLLTVQVMADEFAPAAGASTTAPKHRNAMATATPAHEAIRARRPLSEEGQDRLIATDVSSTSSPLGDFRPTTNVPRSQDIHIHAVGTGQAFLLESRIALRCRILGFQFTCEWRNGSAHMQRCAPCTD
jgi:hypothetical protein